MHNACVISTRTGTIGSLPGGRRQVGGVWLCGSQAALQLVGLSSGGRSLSSVPPVSSDLRLCPRSFVTVPVTRRLTVTCFLCKHGSDVFYSSELVFLKLGGGFI
jgi:hypothetical protein